MIERLDVRGVGGIRSAKIVFNGDFIVITGESGSGKSSLVRALEFIAGKRAQLSYIHSFEESCEVSAVMTSAPLDGLEEKFQPQENSLIIRRSFSRSGRGKCLVQEQPTPLSLLAKAMEPNVVIQSQFAQLSLLEPAKQLELVDSIGGDALADTLDKLKTAFASALDAEKNMVAMKKRRRESELRYEGAANAIRQIKALSLNPESEEEWGRELEAIAVKEAETRTIRLENERMNGTENGLLDQLEASARNICSSAHGTDARWRSAVEKMLAGAHELSTLLSAEYRKHSSDTALEEEKEKLERKLGMLRKLKRELKLKTVAELINFAEEASAELEWLQSSRTELERMEKDSLALRRETSNLAMELRSQRKAAAAVLAEAVNGHLKELGMEYASFGIEIEPLNRVRSSGAENVVFTLAMPDQEALPVGKNASGGELSRILIAIQLSAGNNKLPGTLVFDEVEAGLGGRTALLAGWKLKQLSQRCRTILITHQATIAAMADQHLVVRRNGEDTEIREISGHEREREIARMLSGDENAPEALEHAKALLENNWTDKGASAQFFAKSEQHQE